MKSFTSKNVFITGKEGYIFKYLIPLKYSFPDWKYTNFLKYKHWPLFKRLLYTLLYYPRQTLKLFRKITFLKGKDFILGTDIWGGSYYHWFAESLPKIYNFTNIYKSSVVVLPGNCKKDYIEKSLDLLNINFKTLDTDKNYFLPQLDMLSNLPSHKIIDVHRLFRDKFSHLENKEKSCVFVSRKKAIYRRVQNETEVIKKLREFGFVDVILEDLSWEDQIKTIYNAKILVGMHGAGLTNMLFMERESTVLEFRISDCHYSNNCYLTMASRLDHNYYSLMGDNKYVSKDLGDDDVTINIEHLEILMKEVLNRQ